MARKIVAATCICEPNSSGMDNAVPTSLISKSSPITYRPIKSDIWAWKDRIFLDLIDSHANKIKDTKKRIDVITDINGMNSAKSRFNC